MEVLVKKLLGAVVATLALASNLQAGPVQNAVKPMAYQDGVFMTGNNDYTMRLGLVSDNVFDRYLQKKDKQHVHNSAIGSNSAVITFGFFDRADVWTSFGAGSFGYEDQAAGGATRFKSATEDDLIWGFGGNVILYNMDFTTLSGFASYRHLKADVKEIEFNGDINEYASQSKVKAKYRDWNIGLSLAHQIDNFTPFVNIKYSDAEVKWDNATITAPSSWTFSTLKSRSHIGASIGCSMMASKKFSLSVEGRFFDERALTFSAELRF
jgi:hypothetical protein